MESFPEAARALVQSLTAEAETAPHRAVAFQGAPGCNGHAAVLQLYPDSCPLPCFSFEDALDAVAAGRASRAVIPVENSLNGRVADIHFLLPESGLAIADEYIHPIRHSLMGKGDVADVTEVLSHPQALGQCRHSLRSRNLRPVAFVDTAAAAAQIASGSDRSVAALAPPIAAQLYGLKIIEGQLSDRADNRTRFLVLVRDPVPADGPGPWLTTLLFRVRNAPAALYKSLGAFATNGVNMIKLESYQPEGDFVASEFYCDIEGHPEDPAVARSLGELRFHCDTLRLLGTYRRAR